MAAPLSLCFIILSCTVFVQADVAHLGYRRYSGQRGQSLRLQRLEVVPTPYPGAGYRPNREFNLPGEQPLFPLADPQSNRPHASSGFDNLGETQTPEFVYGSPDQEPRFPHNNRPQNVNGFNGFNGLNEPQPFEFSNDNRVPQQQSFNDNNDFNTDFNSFAESDLQSQQNPVSLYGAPNNPEEGFDNLSQPQATYNAPSARLRQQLSGRLQQAQRLHQQSQSRTRQQSFSNSPQLLYSSPSRQQRAQAPAESKTSRLIARKSARLTDQREETEEVSDGKSSETVEEIETTTKAERKSVSSQAAAAPAAGAVVPLVANAGYANYYPTGAFSFAQPFSGAYVSSANYPTVQPISGAYTVGSPFLTTQYTLAGGAPAQLQAW